MACLYILTIRLSVLDVRFLTVDYAEAYLLSPIVGTERKLNLTIQFSGTVTQTSIMVVCLGMDFASLADELTTRTGEAFTQGSKHFPHRFLLFTEEPQSDLNGQSQ